MKLKRRLPGAFRAIGRLGGALLLAGSTAHAALAPGINPIAIHPAAGYGLSFALGSETYPRGFQGTFRWGWLLVNNTDQGDWEFAFIPEPGTMVSGFAPPDTFAPALRHAVPAFHAQATPLSNDRPRLLRSL